MIDVDSPGFFRVSNLQKSTDSYIIRVRYTYMHSIVWLKYLIIDNNKIIAHLWTGKGHHEL